MQELVKHIIKAIDKAEFLIAGKTSAEASFAAQMGAVLDKTFGRLEKNLAQGMGKAEVSSLFLSKDVQDKFASMLSETVLEEAAIPLTSPIASIVKQQTFEASAATLKRLDASVMDTISNGVNDGLTNPEIVAQLQEKFADMEEYELDRIVRSEVHSAAGLQGFQDMLDSDIQYHQWKTNSDGRERESHAEIDGEIARVGSTFSNGLLFPGDKNGPIEEWINCRCKDVIWIMPEGYSAPNGDAPFYEEDIINLKGEEENVDVNNDIPEIDLQVLNSEGPGIPISDATTGTIALENGSTLQLPDWASYEKLTSKFTDTAGVKALRQICLERGLPESIVNRMGWKELAAVLRNPSRLEEVITKMYSKKLPVTLPPTVTVPKIPVKPPVTESVKLSTLQKITKQKTIDNIIDNINYDKKLGLTVEKAKELFSKVLNEIPENILVKVGNFGKYGLEIIIDNSLIDISGNISAELNGILRVKIKTIGLRSSEIRNTIIHELIGHGSDYVFDVTKLVSESINSRIIKYASSNYNIGIQNSLAQKELQQLVTDEFTRVKTTAINELVKKGYYPNYETAVKKIGMETSGNEYLEFDKLTNTPIIRVYSLKNPREFWACTIENYCDPIMNFKLKACSPDLYEKIKTVIFNGKEF